MHFSYQLKTLNCRSEPTLACKWPLRRQTTIWVRQVCACVKCIYHFVCVSKSLMQLWVIISEGVTTLPLSHTHTHTLTSIWECVWSFYFNREQFCLLWNEANIRWYLVWQFSISIFSISRHTHTHTHQVSTDFRVWILSAKQQKLFYNGHCICNKYTNQKHTWNIPLELDN